MHARVFAPCGECFQRALRVVNQIGADAEFGGEALRQFVLRAHRQFKVLESVRGDVKHMRQVEKRRHAVARIVLQFGSQRVDQNIGGTRVIVGQKAPQCRCNVSRARHQFKRFETVEHRGGEAARIERRMHRRDRCGDAFRHIGAEAVFQRFSHAYGALPGSGCR